MDDERLALVAWAAGFFDGEGTVMIGHGKREGWYDLRLDVGQTVSGPLLRLQELWGGTIVFRRLANPRHADVYRWRVGNKAAALACREMLPFLTVKKDAALVALEFASTLHPRYVTKYRPLTQAEIRLRASLKERLGVINKKGKREEVTPWQPKPQQESPQLILIPNRSAG